MLLRIINKHITSSCNVSARLNAGPELLSSLFTDDPVFGMVAIHVSARVNKN